MNIEESIEKLRELQRAGYGYVCLNTDCNIVYRVKPTEIYEDGHGSRLIEMCRCGCDIFGTIDWVIDKLKAGEDSKPQPPSNPRQ